MAKPTYLDVIRPSEIRDSDRLIGVAETWDTGPGAGRRYSSCYYADLWDEGSGKLWAYRESLGLRGVVRAETWETAHECVIDEIADDCTPEKIAEFYKENPSAEENGELPEGCHWRANGVPSNPRLSQPIASTDLNGSVLDPLPDRWDPADPARAIWIIVERDPAEDDWEYFDGLTGTRLITMPAECADDCSWPGQAADHAVAHWRDKVQWHGTREDLIRMLRETGGWDREELDGADDNTIKDRALWLGACAWREEMR